MLLPLALALTASAASFDPDFRWATVRTEHFAITFHQGEEQVAEEMIVSAERAWDALTEELKTAPKQCIQLVLVDPTDSANGYATIVPNNQIVIFVTAPQEDSSLDYYDDWGSTIVTHELAHILHLDTVGGLPKIGRYIFGRIVSPNLVSPGWITEGFGTFQETRHTQGGRGRAPVVDMVKRTAWLEDRFPPLDTLDGYQSRPPAGNLRYVFGQDFMQFIADRSGEDKWTEWIHRYGASIPYFLGGKKTFGASLYRLHREWVEAVGERYRAQLAPIEAEGLSVSTPITPERMGCGAASWSPNGQWLAYACNDPRRGSAIYIDDGTGTEHKVLVRNILPKNMVWRADSKAIVFSQLGSSDLYNSFDDVFTYELASKRIRRITSGERARDPAYSPDGEQLLVVTNKLRNNNLSLITVDGQRRALTHYTDHTQLGTPRFSPDGSVIALSVWRGGTRDLWLYTPDGQPLQRLTLDMASDRDPAWSPDGRFLLFTSDRSGVPNIYAWERATGRLFRVTNVRTGAFGATVHPDGTRMAYELFTTNGGRIVTADFDPQGWKDLGVIPNFPNLDEEGEPVAAGDDTSAVTTEGGKNTDSAPELPNEAATSALPAAFDPFAKKQQRPPPWKPPETLAGLPVRRYNPWPLAFPPRYWLPSAYLTSTGDSIGLLAYAITGGSDPLKMVAWSGYLSYRTDARFFGGGGSFVWNRWRPVLGTSFSSSAWPYGLVYTQSEAPSGGPFLPGIESARMRYWDHRLRGSATVSYPLSTKSSVVGYYQGTLRRSLDPLPEDVYNPQLPTRGFFSSVGVGWSYSTGSSTTLSISPERARVLSLGVEGTPAFLGSYTFNDDGVTQPFNQLRITAQWREYRTVPGIPNHVVALRLTGGASVGDRFKYGSFRLGGYYSENGVTVVPDEFRSLRGFGYGADSGEWYWQGSGEYRFPIWRIERGLGALPLFVRWISGTVLVDAGNAFDDVAGASMQNSKVGVGAELNVAMIAGWGSSIYARGGYAFSAYGGGIPIGDIQGLYLALGSSF